MGPEDQFDPSDRDGLILQYSPLIKFVANRLAIRLPPHIEVDDLFSSGVLGLMDAIEKYDPSRKAKFKTYAEFRIRGAMLDELRSLDWVPRSVRERTTRLESAFSRVEQKLGRSATDEEVAEFMDLDMEEFQDLLSRSGGISLLSLDEVFSATGEGEGRTLFEQLAGLEEEEPQAMHALEEMKRVVGEFIDQMPVRERLILSLYYHEEMTMKEIGETIGVTESRVSQLHSKAIARIKGRLKGVFGN